MFKFDLIDEYQIEITTYCNAACPQCPRNINGGVINPHLPLCHLDRGLIDQRFDINLCGRLRQIFFCGSYGDPIMHPQFLDILRDFRLKNPQLWLYIHTNGGVHDSEYWQQLAKILAGAGQVDFGIDGLEDTLSLYRQNVSWHRVMSNTKAFIDAGGRAQWNFIVFRHNQHQIDQARALSQQMGFHDFLPRRTGRFFNHAKESAMETWPVMDRDGHVRYQLEPSDHAAWRNPSVERLPELKSHYQDLDQYWSTTPIACDAAMGKKVAVNAEGLVLPCNFFNHNLHDARFHETDVLPGRHRLHDQQGRNQVRTFLERYGLSRLDLHHHSLEQIFACEMWDDLVRSWTQELGAGRLFECAMTCGQKFTKVWDQGGSKR